MRRLVPSILPLVPVLLLAACADASRQPIAPGDARRVLSAVGQFGDSLPGISSSDLLLFKRGRYLFQKRFTQTKGLGPTFNDSSCAKCHGEVTDPLTDSVIGSVFTTANHQDTHFTRLNSDGSCSPLTIYGGFVQQTLSTNWLRQQTAYDSGEALPTVTHQVALRSTPDLFGFGLIAAIPDAAILARADPNDADNDGISGRAHMLGNNVGRFGRKAAGDDLDTFNAAALLHEIGMTNSQFMVENSIGGWAIPTANPDPASVDTTPEPELDNDDLAALNAYIRFLAPPPPLLPHDSVGESLFASTGCAKCHTQDAYTTVSSIAALNGQSVRPFSDFLLHDMGSPGDICLVHAGPTEFRTEPLMGARKMRVFMHDGLATSIDQAISQHGGEGDAARTAYNNLTSDQREKLIDYINTL